MKPELRVLEIIQDNRLGGISVRALSTATHLRHYGVECKFVLPNEPGDVADACRSRGFEALQILLKRPHPGRLWQTLVWLITFPWSVWQLARLIRDHRANVIHVNGLIGLQAAAAAKLTGTPLVWHLAGTRSYPRWFVRWLRPVIRRSECIVSISPRVEEYFLGAAGSRPAGARVIHEPIDLAAVAKRSHQTDRVAIRRALKIGRDEKVICTVGNLSPVKGTQVLIDAAARLCAQRHDLRFLVVGARLDTQADYVAQVERSIDENGLRDRVRLLGKRADVYELLRASDLFVLPSLSEGTPISILEAMANRIPVIASEVGGIPDQIEDGVSGCLVPPGDAEAIAETIDRLLNTPDLARGYADAAYRRVGEQFSLDQYVPAFVAALHSACCSDGKRRTSVPHASPAVPDALPASSGGA